MLDVNRLDGVYDQPYIFILKQIHDAVTFHENKSRVVRVFPMRCSYDAFLLYFPHFISTFFLISIAVILVYFVRDYSYEFIHAFLLLFMLKNDFAVSNDFIENSTS